MADLNRGLCDHEGGCDCGALDNPHKYHLKEMMVMPANNCHRLVHRWAKEYPGRIGHLYSPDGFRGPYQHLQYALDNGAYGYFARGEIWEAPPWMRMLEKAAKCDQKPLWIAVPDVVGNREATLAFWNSWSATARRLCPDVPLAFVAQDGMALSDVPDDAEVVFIGGSTEWKWSVVWLWARSLPHVHVGRVNGYHRLYECQRAGVKSVDGTGWFRGRDRQLYGLQRWLRETADGPKEYQLDIFFEEPL
jgi:hypothetical protein